ncbi:MAG: LemA family protein [Bacteroidia bacterium]|nr:LemA family protein [Bacteroidia bacterium]
MGIVIGILFVIFIILGIMAYTSYNGMVTRDETVKKQWGNVQASYEKRNALIGELVGTVKGYTGHENKTLTEVIEARAKATSVTVKAENLTAENMAQFQQAQSGVNNSLSRLLVSVEQYPNLKADTHFTDLMKQLKNIEDNIVADRKKFNTDTQEYNTYIRKFPKNIFAGIFGFKEKDYYKAEEGSSKSPKIQF